MSDPHRDYFQFTNAIAAILNAGILCARLPDSAEPPLLNAHVAAKCVASFALVTSLAGACVPHMDAQKARVGYAFYMPASLLVLAFYLYTAILCLVDFPLHAGGSIDGRSIAGICISVCILMCPTIYCAARMAGRAWSAARLGATCSFVSLVLACTLASFGASLRRQDATSGTLVVVAACFELLASALGIPIYLLRWKNLLRAHTAWSCVSSFVLLAGVSTAVHSDERLFELCRQTGGSCDDRTLIMLAAMAAITVVAS